jgi:ribonuclease PH
MQTVHVGRCCAYTFGSIEKEDCRRLVMFNETPTGCGVVGVFESGMAFMRPTRRAVYAQVHRVSRVAGDSNDISEHII